MKVATLLWSEDDIRVIAGEAKFTEKLKIASQDRYWLSLSSDHNGRLYLRAAQGRCPFWIREDRGFSFKPLDCIPGEGPPIQAYHSKLHRRFGMVTALENNTLWVWRSGIRWIARPLPAELIIRDVSFDRDGGLWCAGAVRSQRIPGEETEAAVRYQSREGIEFVSRSPRLNPLSAAKTIAEGGLGELRTIDAEGDPLVATSICSWILEDESSFVYVFDKGRTYVKRLKAEIVRYIDRPQPGLVRVFSSQGGIWQGTGSRLKHRSIVNALRNSFDLSQRPILIRGMDAFGDRIAVAVEVAKPGVSGFAQDPEFTAVCLSADGGNSFELMHRFAFGDGIEALDVVVMAEE